MFWEKMISEGLVFSLFFQSTAMVLVPPRPTVGEGPLTCRGLSAEGFRNGSCVCSYFETLVSQIMCVSRWTSCNLGAGSAVLGLTGALGQECWPRCGSYPALKSILAMQTEPYASPNALQRSRRSGFNREGGTLKIIKVWCKQTESLQGRNIFRTRQRDGAERQLLTLWIPCQSEQICLHFNSQSVPEKGLIAV